MLLGWDTETHLFKAFSLLPKVVCSSFAWETEEGFETDLRGGHKDDKHKDMVQSMLSNDDIEIVAHNAAFDMGVVCANWPELIPLVFGAYEAKRIHCTQNREKLLNLSDFGLPDQIPNGNGSFSRASYTLASLAKKYLGVDRSAEKEGEDIWRLNYHKLDGRSAKDYPKEASDYARADALDTLGVFLAQEQRKKDKGLSTETEHLQNASHFALTLCSAWGVKINLDKKEEIRKHFEEITNLRALPLLVTSGLVAPAVPPRPSAKRVRAHVEGCPKKKVNKVWSCDCPLKLNKPIAEKRNMKLIRAKVTMICGRLGVEVPMSDKSEKFPEGQIKTDKKTVERLAPHDPVLSQYQTRQKWQKILTTEIPRMGDIGCMFPSYDPIKETGRTSSFDGGKKSGIASGNIQNVDPKVRGCYEPREGCVLLSVDIKAMELVSAAQKCYSLFGHSVLRDRINAGIDTHAYLGSQLAWCMDEDFKAATRKAKAKTVMQVYEFFANLGTSEDEITEDEKRAWAELPKEKARKAVDRIRKERPLDCVRFPKTYYAHWRKFAKPVGLGYPGGLGAATFIDLAAGYGFLLDLPTATLLKEIWLNTYPEFDDYFNWVKKSCKDPKNSDADGRPYYTYTTPLGLVRAGATYCAAANGAALQAPGAEGAKLGFYRIQRECYDPSLDSVLLGCRSVAFIHDEALLEIPYDDFMQERAERVVDIMVCGLGVVLPDMLVEAEPALMLEWDKRAEAVYDQDNRLTIWRPETREG